MEINKEVLRVATYLRVSTDEQAEHGYGLTLQEEKMKAFIDLHDYEFDKSRHEFKDEGYSGTLPASKRPGLQKLFESAERKEFDVVIVYRLDRFGRKILLILDGVKQLSDCGVGFRSATEPFDTSSPFGMYLLTSLGALAELERETIKERTQGGRRIAAMANKWIWGTPPYGYKISPTTKKLIVVKKEAEWVKKFMEWIVDEGLSLSAVQRRANEQKVPCYNKRKRRKEVMSGFWHKKTISKMISNPIYTGKTHFFRFKGEFRGLSSLKDDSLQNAVDQWVEFNTTAIVSEDLFERCQKQLVTNREMASRNLKNDYLYNKLIWCSECDKKLFAGRKRGSRFYHSALNAKWRKAIHEESRCICCGQISESALEPIWLRLEKILRNPRYMIPRIQNNISKPKSDKKLEEQLIEQKNSLTILITKSKKIDRVYLSGDSIGSNEEYLKLKSKVKREMLEIRKSINGLENKLKAVSEIKEKDINNIIELFEKVGTRLDNITYKQKSLIIHLLVKKIALNKDKKQASVYLNIIEPNKEITPSSLTKSGIESLLCNPRLY